MAGSAANHLLHAFMAYMAARIAPTFLAFVAFMAAEAAASFLAVVAFMAATVFHDFLGFPSFRSCLYDLLGFHFLHGKLVPDFEIVPTLLVSSFLVVLIPESPIIMVGLIMFMSILIKAVSLRLDLARICASLDTLRQGQKLEPSPASNVDYSLQPFWKCL